MAKLKRRYQKANEFEDKWTKKSGETTAVLRDDHVIYAGSESGDYFIENNIEGVTHWLGFSKIMSNKIITDFDLIFLAIDGITKASITTLAGHLGISRKYISENIFDVSVKTLERKENKAKMDKKTSSHALEIAKVVQHAHKVFRDNQKVKRWLSKENQALHDRKPVELFDTLTGISMVNDLLGRIEEGVYS